MITRRKNKTSIPEFSIEADLVGLCAGTKANVHNQKEIETILERKIDWLKFIDISRKNCTMSLMYWNLRDVPSNPVPDDVMEELRHHFQLNARRNMIRIRELFKVLIALQAEGIRAMPLKGPVLASTVYGNIALREFSDLDILIEETDLQKTLEILRRLKFNLRAKDDLDNNSDELEDNPVYVFDQVGGISTIDLHCSLSRPFLPFPIDEKGLWERAEKVEIAGTSVIAPSKEDLLLILCMHGSRHLWSRLQWVSDVAELIKHNEDLEWVRIIQRAEILGSRRMLNIGLVLAKEILDAPVPPKLLEEAKADATANILVSQVCMNIFADGVGEEDVIHRAFFRFRARERMRDKLPNLIFLASKMLKPNSEDRSLIRLPSRVSFLYYLVRPIRLVGLYGFSPLRRT